MRRVGHDEEREEEEGGEQQREKSVSEGWGESVGRGGRAGVTWRPRKEEWVRAEWTSKRDRGLAVMTRGKMRNGEASRGRRA